MADLISDAYGRARYDRIGELSAKLLDPGRPGGREIKLPDLDVPARTLKISDTRFGVGEPTFASLPPVSEWAKKKSSLAIPATLT